MHRGSFYNRPHIPGIGRGRAKRVLLPQNFSPVLLYRQRFHKRSHVSMLHKAHVCFRLAFCRPAGINKA